MHPNPNPGAPSLGGLFGCIISCPVLNVVYGDNNPLGNECHFEMMGGDLNARQPTLLKKVYQKVVPKRTYTSICD